MQLLFHFYDTRQSTYSVRSKARRLVCSREAVGSLARTSESISKACRCWSGFSVTVSRQLFYNCTSKLLGVINNSMQKLTGNITCYFSHPPGARLLMRSLFSLSPTAHASIIEPMRTSRCGHILSISYLYQTGAMPQALIHQHEAEKSCHTLVRVLLVRLCNYILSHKTSSENPRKGSTLDGS